MDVVQLALAQIAIAFSVFNLVTYLWLGLMVLLIGDRRSRVTWVGGLGLLLGALFFLTHGALVGGGVPSGASPADVWWHLAWVPAFATPFFWAATGRHYADLTSARGWRDPALLAVAAIGAVAALLAILSWRDVGQYGDFIRLIDAALHAQLSAQSAPLLPYLGLAFVLYIGACASLPWASLVKRRFLPSTASSAEASAAPEARLLWDARDAWSRGRTALLGASVCMLAAGVVVALIGVIVALGKQRAALAHVVASTGIDPAIATPTGHVPLPLVAADLVVQIALAGVGLLVGWAVVRQGIVVERRLPQRGALSHWLGMAVVAGIFACVVEAMTSFEPEALPEYLLLSSLVAAAAALVAWQSYIEHDKLLAQLRPFIDSFSVSSAGWLATDTGEIERRVGTLFTSLCRDVLGASHGRLALSAGRLRRTFTYSAHRGGAQISASGSALRQPWPRAERDAHEWEVPVSDERGVVARITIGARVDGAGYTSADLEIVRACGQRILDAVGDFAAAQAIASLARRRGLEAELSAALPRRTLHDEILPRLHLAMLSLETVRARLTAPATVSATPVASVATLQGGEAQVADVPVIAEVAGSSDAPSPQAELARVVGELGHAHHDLASLMRAMPTVSVRRLEHGLVGVLRSALDGEFRGAFDAVAWEVPPEAASAADALPSIVADLLLGATLEAVRNASRYGRGDDLHRKLTLALTLAAEEDWVCATIADDGVGLHAPAREHGDHANDQTEAALAERLDEGVSLPAASSATALHSPGTGSGLLTHAALIALIGGSLTLQSEANAGTTVSIRVPRARDPRN